MSRVIKIWVYKKIERSEFEDCKPSKTNLPVIKDVRGDFEYYEVDGDTSAHKVTRRDADKYAERTGEKVELLLGYPAFMHDMGYRA